MNHSEIDLGGGYYARRMWDDGVIQIRKDRPGERESSICLDVSVLKRAVAAFDDRPAVTSDPGFDGRDQNGTYR